MFRPRDEGATNNDHVIEVDAEEIVPTKRSEGIKKAKEKLRRGGGEVCMEAVDRMWAKKEVLDKEKEKPKRRGSWLH